EDVTRAGDEILVNEKVREGDFIRRRGSDLVEGQRLVTMGERIRTTTVALLASQGFGEIRVGGQVDGAIISTGDELISPGKQIRAGQIYESNSALLRALLQRT